MKKVLIIEDDTHLARVIGTTLENKVDVGFSHTLENAYIKLKQTTYDIIITDRMLMNQDALDIVPYIREVAPDTKIICISQLHSVHERIKGLEEGVDDYLPKPFSVRELVIKVEKLLAMERIIHSEVETIGELTIDIKSGILSTSHTKIKLKKKEKQLLQCLLRYRNQAVSRDMIMTTVWNEDKTPCDTTLDVSVRRLRVQLQQFGYLIKTIRGYGYMLKF